MKYLIFAISTSLSALSLTMCAAPKAPVETTINETLSTWSLNEAAGVQIEPSCAEGEVVTPGKQLTLTVAPVTLGTPTDVAAALPDGVSFAGGWHLSADDENFGGLSGLDFMGDDTLLAVSDAGAFVTLEMEDGAPTGSAAISYMKGEDGLLLSGKNEADAEGLIYHDGLALVSFEHNHRVMAFNFGTCGAEARGIQIAALPEKLGGQRIRPNSGAEAFAPDMNGYFVVGLETSAGGKAIRAKIMEDGSVAEVDPLPSRDGLKLVGSDLMGHVFRAYDPARGNRIDVTAMNMTEPFRLERPLNVDNFEGIAIRSLPREAEGIQRARLYLISDNNFSGRQRTLLYAFDITEDLSNIH